MLKEMIPQLTRVAVLHDASLRSNRAAVGRIATAGQAMGIEIQPVSVSAAEELEGAFTATTTKRAGALIVVVSRLASTQRKPLVALTLKYRVPAMCWQPSLAKLGCLMSYGADRLDMVRRSASHVHRILKGAKPAELPVELPTKFNLVVNLKTAKALGIAIPRAILLRADEVIE